MTAPRKSNQVVLIPLITSTRFLMRLMKLHILPWTLAIFSQREDCQSMTADVGDGCSTLRTTHALTVNTRPKKMTGVQVKA